MKTITFLLLAGSVPVTVLAGELPSAKAAAIDIPASDSRWRAGISFAPLLNARAGFSNLGAFSSPFSPQPLGGGQNYEYENGYVRVDASGNAGDATTNWGYADASQYDPSGGGSIAFSLTRSLGNGSARETEDISPGFELFGYYEMGDITLTAGRPLTWGLRTGIHYANLSAGGRGTLTSDAERLTDRFVLGGIIPPSAGYEGTFGGPGALLSDDPQRTTTVIADGASVSGDRDIDLDMVTFSAGPYLEIPLHENVSLFAEAGLSLSVARGEYEFESVTNISGLGSQTSRGDNTRTKLLPGFFTGLSAAWQLTERFGIHGSVRYQYIDRFDVDAAGSSASFTFDGAAIISLGGVWSF